MWKILKPHGLLIIISTITEELLQSLINAYLVYFDVKEKKGFNASNWSRGHVKEALRTSSNDVVYYYSIQKLHSLQEKKELMMDSINQLLQEAKTMKENEEWEELVS
jgi:hypothetical protein